MLFLVLVIAGISNGVNLTDGLDGLAIGCVLISAVALTVLTYLSSNARFAEYLEIQKIPDAAELTIFCGSLVGASLGFLWYNAHPAEMFMGDVGSLALGGAIGTVAVILKQEILLLSIGGVFILELLSVIIQVGSFKLTGKRVFRMAPLHHHFELIGMERIENHRAVLDSGAGVRAVFADDFEIEVGTADEVRMRPGFDLEGKRVLVVGLARTGRGRVAFRRGLRRDGDGDGRKARKRSWRRASARLRAAGVKLELGRAYRLQLPRTGFDRRQPRRAGELAGARTGARAAAFPFGAKSNWRGDSCAASWWPSPARTARPPRRRSSRTF